MVWTKRMERMQRATEKLLQLVNVTEPPVPVEHIAYVRGVRLRKVPFSATLVGKQEGELSGLLLWEHGRVVIGVNELHSQTRQRFAIAHQLGHLELHYRDGMHIDEGFPVALREGSLDLPHSPDMRVEGKDRQGRGDQSGSYHQGGGKPRPYHTRGEVGMVDAVEVEANSFASELLMPVGLLERDLKGHVLDYEDDALLRGLAERYSVSLQVMIFRLVSLRLIAL